MLMSGVCCKEKKVVQENNLVEILEDKKSRLKNYPKWYKEVIAHFSMEIWLGRMSSRI